MQCRAGEVFLSFYAAEEVVTKFAELLLQMYHYSELRLVILAYADLRTEENF